MPQSLSATFLHAVFSTSGRTPFLSDVAIRAEMHAYLGAASRQLDCPPVIVGGTEDHVHILSHFGRTISQADWIKEMKRVSSIWIKERDSSLAEFAWQRGYGTFSVSVSSLDKVRGYIENQAEHHRRRTFQEEFRGLLRKHQIEWDERYVWD